VVGCCENHFLAGLLKKLPNTKNSYLFLVLDNSKGIANHDQKIFKQEQQQII
jgi:hypothetical protein